MNVAALFHRSLDNWCYALDAQTLHLRLQTAADDVDSVDLVAGDPFDGEGKNWKGDALPMRRTANDGVHDVWEAEYRPPLGRTKYYFRLRGGGETWVYTERGARRDPVPPLELLRDAFLFPSIHANDGFQAPAWVHGVVWYEIFPDRFHRAGPGSDGRFLPWRPGRVTNEQHYGGNLRGITQKLDHLVDLGVGGLYLTPLFASPSVHKYDTVDYHRVDPDFGTEDDLKTLVTEAHRRGLRVLLDGVFNHVGTGFFAWADVLKNGLDSPYASWFHIHDASALRSGHGYQTFAFARNMPKLNTTNPEVRAYLIDVAVSWIRRVGVDGWRLDVGNEVDHEFWRAFRQAVRAEAPEAYLVGEAWYDGLRWLRGDQFDAVMGYRYAQAIGDFVRGRPNFEAREFAQAIDGLDASLPLPVVKAGFHVLDSHDTERFVTQCGDPLRARLGWFLLFFLRGSPCLYYGSEVGLEGGPDPDNRRCMLWDEAAQDRQQYTFLQTLVRLRTREAGLFTEGSRQWLLDPHRPERLGLRISGDQMAFEAWVDRRPEPASWPSVPGHVLLESSGPWGYRVVLTSV